MRPGAASTMLVTALALMGIARLVNAVDGVNGALDTSMTGPRRIERQNRVASGGRHGRTLSTDALNGVMDWEYGGWRPLQTPKGFYRRIARNLFRDDEGRGPNEVDNGGDLEAASSSKSSSFHALGLEDFLRSGPGCGDCGFQPLIFLNGRGPRKIRSTSSHTGFEDAQILDTHREVNIDIRDAVKEKLRERRISAFLKRSRRSSDSSGNTIPVGTLIDNKDEKVIVSEPSGEKESAKSDALDEAKRDRITPGDEEPHFLSPKGILSVAKSIAEALATKRQREQSKAPSTTTTEASPATEVNVGTKLEDEEAHFLSPKAIFGIGKGIAEALAKDLPAPSKPEGGTIVKEEKLKDDEEAHFLSPKAVIGVAKGIAEALATKKPDDEAGKDKKIDSDEPHFLSPKAIFSLTEQVTKALVTGLPHKDKVNATVTTQGTDQSQTSALSSSSGMVNSTVAQPAAREPIIPDDVHFLSPSAIYGILKGIGEAAAKTAQKEAAAATADRSPSDEPKSRMRRQIWNPFRRRPNPPKQNIGGQFGFVNQNVPYEAQGSINSFSFAQNLPQSSAFQSNDFQGIQSFVPPPPITNYEKVNGPLDSHYPGIEGGQHLLSGSADFSSPNTPQFAPEPVVSGPPPTRPVKRPEQIQPGAPPSSTSAGLPPPHVIESLLVELRTTGQIPPNLSPETALLLADILSGRKEHISTPVQHFSSSPVAPAIDVPPGPFVPESPAQLPQAQVKPPKYQRDPAPAPNFHQGALASPPVSFGTLPSPPKRSQGIVRDKVIPATSHEVLYHHAHSPVTDHVTHIASVPHGHDGLHLNAEGFQRPHTVTRVRTRKRKKPVTSVAPSASKLNLAEHAAEHAVEKDHSSIFPQEHVHIHHHHKRKRKRPTVAPVAKIPVPAPEIHLPDKVVLPDSIVPPETSVHDIHHHTLVHDGSHFAVHDQHSKLDAKIHLDTKSHGHSGSGLSLEAELGSASKNHPVTIDPLQNIDNDGSGLVTAKPNLANVANSEYYDDLFRKATTTTTPSSTVAVGSDVNTGEDSAWPVDDPYLSPPSSTESSAHTVGPEDILIQDAKPGIPLMASDLNSLKLKTNHHNHQSGGAGSGNKVDAMPAPVFRPEAHTTRNAEADAKKQATQDEDDISAGAGAIHFQPIQTKEGDSKATGNAQLYHAYYAPAHHDPPPGYIRMTVDEFNKLFKDAEIQFIGSEQELQKKLGTKPTNKLNFDINNSNNSDAKKVGSENKDDDGKNKQQDA